MIHCGGIPLHKSENLNAWPMLGAVLELSPMARTRADNTLVLGIRMEERSRTWIQFCRCYPHSCSRLSRSVGAQEREGEGERERERERRKLLDDTKENVYIHIRIRISPAQGKQQDEEGKSQRSGNHPWYRHHNAQERRSQYRCERSHSYDISYAHVRHAGPVIHGEFRRTERFFLLICSVMPKAFIIIKAIVSFMLWTMDPDSERLNLLVSVPDWRV